MDNNDLILEQIRAENTYLRLALQKEKQKAPPKRKRQRTTEAKTPPIESNPILVVTA
jgi:hypothetical protein